MTTDLDGRPVPSEGNAYCDRCDAMTPIEEWRLVKDGKVWMHCGNEKVGGGGLRIKCGFQIRIPQNA